ncbi:MAG: hypothetical protein H0U03_02160 [Actinobacteria bacterium]|nr:hypothetical protein [Actinomycetota bacterium]
MQCKWAARDGDVVAVRCYSTRRQASGFLKHVYELNQVDAIAAYCPDLERCYLLPLARFGRRSTIQLRLTPPRNSQRLGIVWAYEFEFAATLRTLAGP